jgi:hypothetical protein
VHLFPTIIGYSKDVKKVGTEQGWIKPMRTKEAFGKLGRYDDMEARTSSQEDKAARLREYKRLSALARKKSKEAASVKIGENV